MISIILFMTCISFANGCAKGDIAIARTGHAEVNIVLADDASLQERTAAEELQHYLQLITTAQFTIINENEARDLTSGIWVGPTKKANASKLLSSEPEAWSIKTDGQNLILCGGRRRGTLYAVYHFLEDHLGVRWWNPQEEYVPQNKDLSIPAIDRKGKPAFERRCININYTGTDRGDNDRAFVVRNRMNSSGPFEGRIDPRFGCDDGMLISARPWCAHSLDAFIPDRAGMFKKHPEYFALLNGKRDKRSYDLTNPDLRNLLANKLKELIEYDRTSAKAQRRPYPLVYNFSKEDHPNLYSETPKSIAIRMREGSESGVLMDFVNDQARRVKQYAPDVLIDTLAYQNTENPPKVMALEDNVMITLCDTESIVTLPITHRRNKEFADRVIAWSTKTKHLRIWDYGYAYMPESWEYPMPTEFTYRPDYQFFLKNGVQGIFTQFETRGGALLGDMPDMKRWMIAKLMEDPTLNTDQLIKDFTDGYYGPAGKYIRNYRKSLYDYAKVKQPGYTILCGPEHTTLHYLDTTFLVKAKRLFDQAEEVCGDDTTLLRRVRHARAPLDCAELVRYSMLLRQWTLKGKDANEFPLDYRSAAKRLNTTLLEQAEQRLQKGREDNQVKALASRIDKYSQIKPSWPLPNPGNIKASALYEFAPPSIPRAIAPTKVVVDTDAECGLAIRLPWTAPLSAETQLLKAGIHKQAAMPTRIVTTEGPALTKETIQGPGYHWYKVLSNVTVQHDSRFYFACPAAWYIQFQCDTASSLRSSAKYDFWARLKFQGPSFSSDDSDAKDYIYLERVVMIKK